MRQQTGLGLLGMAVLLGLLGDGLLRATPWGLNFPLWVGIAITGGWAVLPVTPERAPAGGWPLITALFFAGCLAWRDAEFLQFWNAVAVLAMLGLPVIDRRGSVLRAMPLGAYLRGLGTAGAEIVRGVFAPVPADVAWGQLGRYRGSAGAGAIGLALALPILVVFGALLMLADAGFASLVRAVLHIDPESFASHVALIAVTTWVCAGYLYSLMRRTVGVIERGEPSPPTRQPALGIVELGVPLGALTALFGVFLGMQANYLFGGETAMARAGLTYAEYARQGFLELTFVSALLLPLLLGADRLFRPQGAAHRMHFRRIVGCLLALTGALMGSALHRVALYVGEYGWSEIRLYASAFIIWLGLVHLTFALTVLRGRGDRFMFGAITTGVAVLAALNVINPEAVIVRSQLHRAETSGDVDARYLASLSADAIPTLLRGTGTLPRAARCLIDEAVRRRLYEHAGDDWRTWNASRAAARRSIASTTHPHCPPNDS